MTSEMFKFWIGTILVFTILISGLMGAYCYNCILLKNDERHINWNEVKIKIKRLHKEKLI